MKQEIKLIDMNNSVSAYDAAKYLGCSYPHLIHIIRNKKLKAQKIRKQWFVDSESLKEAKENSLVVPRPRPTKFKQSNIKENKDGTIEITIKMSSETYAEVKEQIERDPESLIEKIAA
jgi:excisionase family DNA binding protein